MNKQTIITILFVLVAMTGQAQVRTGQDVCLRNEATGDWLIGLFDNYAVYNCAIWEYAKADLGEQSGGLFDNEWACRSCLRNHKDRTFLYGPIFI